MSGSEFDGLSSDFSKYAPKNIRDREHQQPAPPEQPYVNSAPISPSSSLTNSNHDRRPKPKSGLWPERIPDPPLRLDEPGSALFGRIALVVSFAALIALLVIFAKPLYQAAGWMFNAAEETAKAPAPPARPADNNVLADNKLVAPARNDQLIVGRSARSRHLPRTCKRCLLRSISRSQRRRLHRRQAWSSQQSANRSRHRLRQSRHHLRRKQEASGLQCVKLESDAAVWTPTTWNGYVWLSTRGDPSSGHYISRIDPRIQHTVGRLFIPVSSKATREAEFLPPILVSSEDSLWALSGNWFSKNPTLVVRRIQVKRNAADESK